VDNEQMTALHGLMGVLKFKEEWQKKTSGLSATEMFVLEHLDTHDNAFRFNEFAEKYQIKPSSLTNIVERLEAKGLVVRQRDATDRKAVYLIATEQGKSIIDRHIAEDITFINNLFSRLKEDEKTQFLGIIKKMLDGANYAELFLTKEV
jgi:DNA-binding MarR family transcriptional regulator